MGEYIRYYHDARTDLALEKQTPKGRVAATDSEVSCEVVSMPRLGGLHHRYELASLAFAWLRSKRELRTTCKRSASADLLRVFHVTASEPWLKKSGSLCSRI